MIKFGLTRKMGSVPRAIPSVRSYDSDYAAILANGAALGYAPPSIDQRYKQNILLTALKSAGIWSKLDIFYMFATNGDSDFATLNWKNPATFQITKVSSPIFTTNVGFAGDGVAAYLNTNFNPSVSGVNYTLNNASQFCWCTSFAGLDAAGIIGSAANRFQTNNSVTSRLNQSTNSLDSNVPFNTTGWHIINRTSSTNIECFGNTTQYSRTASSTSIQNGNQVCFAAAASFSASGLACYGMGASLVSENTAFYNALNTYIGSL